MQTGNIEITKILPVFARYSAFREVATVVESCVSISQPVCIALAIKFTDNKQRASKNIFSFRYKP